MLYGIGCDLCSLSHLEKSLSSAHAAAFVRRVYGPAEQAALGLLEASPAPLNAHRLASAAADFAAKEAFLKAAQDFSAVTGACLLVKTSCVAHRCGMPKSY